MKSQGHSTRRTGASDRRLDSNRELRQAVTLLRTLEFDYEQKGAAEEAQTVRYIINQLVPPRLDPYSRSASEMFGVPYEDVTPEQRWAAKAALITHLYNVPVKPGGMK